jgi:parallel beta-helix repeat protein
MKATRLAVTAMVFAVLTLLATGLANAQPPKCDTQITACGCTIGASGSYTVENTLYASQGLTLKNGCIDIEGSNINLYDLSYDINGPGTVGDCSADKPKKHAGIGIHVLPSASHVAIYGGEYECGWNYGVESEGNDVHLFDVYTSYNNVGVLLNNATSNDVLYGYAAYAVVGFQIAGGSGNSINGSGAESNSTFGYWVDGSSGNTLSSNYAYYNTEKAGIYLGCNSKGQVNPQILCPKNTPTTGNSIVANYFYDNVAGYGIATEKGAIDNNYNGNYFYSPSPGTNIIDGNGNCVYNQYVGDTFFTASPSCIQ